MGGTKTTLGTTGGSSAGGSTGGNNTVGIVGSACSPNGAYGCAANASVHQVVCVNGAWATNGTCASGLLCDSLPGPSVGTCQTVVPECSGKNPQDSVCNGQNVEICGPDLVTVTVAHTRTNQTCVSGACTGVCAPKQTQ
jgi:hypothetical protein